MLADRKWIRVLSVNTLETEKCDELVDVTRQKWNKLELE
jgi:hypothetical protein